MALIIVKDLLSVRSTVLVSEYISAISAIYSEGVYGEDLKIRKFDL